MIKINLGSGQRPFAKPWVNVDRQEKWNPDIVADGAHMPIFEDGSADMIVLHHVLEHFGCGEANGLIKECHRILAPGGSLIVTVPNMRALAKQWLAGLLTDQVYFTNVYGAYMGDEADRHAWGFSPQSLLERFWARYDWSHVKPFDFRPIDGADIAADWWIVGIECIK